MNPYQTQSVTTAGPAQLVLMLYDGALDEIGRAEVALDEPLDRTEAHDCLTRAQAIVTELSVTLDHDRGGDVARNLSQLYGFCQEQLVEANIAKSGASLPPVARVLRGLRDAWEQACCSGSVAVAG